MKNKNYSQGDMFDKGKQLSLKELLGYDVADIGEAAEWEGMEARLLGALKGFAEAGLMDPLQYQV